MRTSDGFRTFVCIKKWPGTFAGLLFLKASFRHNNGINRYIKDDGEDQKMFQCGKRVPALPLVDGLRRIESKDHCQLFYAESILFAKLLDPFSGLDETDPWQ